MADARARRGLRGSGGSDVGVFTPMEVLEDLQALLAAVR